LGRTATLNIRLDNKVALVIGGTGPVGSAICERLFHSGARVATDYRHDREYEAWLNGLTATGVSIHAFRADTTDFEECATLIQTVEKTLGPIDIIVNNSEKEEEIPFREMSKQQWDDMLAVNIDAVYNTCRILAGGMSERGFGRIINISSVIGRMGKAGQTHLATAKAGIHGFTMALAREMAKKGVTVNTVSPGSFARGDIHAAATVPGDGEPVDTGTGMADVISSKNAREVACMVDFLCSEYASQINGTDIAVNSGQYMY